MLDINLNTDSELLSKIDPSSLFDVKIMDMIKKIKIIVEAESSKQKNEYTKKRLKEDVKKIEEEASILKDIIKKKGFKNSRKSIRDFIYMYVTMESEVKRISEERVMKILCNCEQETIDNAATIQTKIDNTTQ